MGSDAVGDGVRGRTGGHPGVLVYWTYPGGRITTIVSIAVVVTLAITFAVTYWG